MMMTTDPEEGIEKRIKYERASRMVVIAIIILLAIVAVIPGAMWFLYRADAQVALGNAKLVRTALQAAAIESYGQDTPFGDPTAEGGVTEEVYRDVLMTSKVPGDFWVLQFADDGRTVLKFYYREGDYIVFYQAEPSTYEVYRGETYIKTSSRNEE